MPVIYPANEFKEYTIKVYPHPLSEVQMREMELAFLAGYLMGLEVGTRCPDHPSFTDVIEQLTERVAIVNAPR